jgi:hypothetical protein
MNIKRVGVIGVAGLATATVGAWTFGAFDGADEPTAAAAPVAATAPKPAAAPQQQQQAAPVNPLIQKVAPPAAIPAAPAAQPVPVKKVAKIKPATAPEKKVQRQKTRTPVVKAAVAKDSRELRLVQLPPRVIVVEKPAPAATDSSKKINESVDKANGSLDKAKKLIDQAGNEVKKAKGELDKAKGELKKLKSGKHKHGHSPEKAKHDKQKRTNTGYQKQTNTGHVSVDSKGLKPGQSRTATTSSPDGSSWSSATVK